MKKYLSYLICVIVVCLLMSVPMSASDDPVDPSVRCSADIRYAYEGMAVSGVVVDIYRVAMNSDDGEMELAGEFADYPVRINNVTSQAEWNDIAATLSAYILKDEIEPYRTAVSDNSGVAVYDELETGLYLVGGVNAQNGDGKLIFDPFMLHLPVPGTDGYIYDAKVNPKGVEFIPDVGETEYKVLKLWRDSDGTEYRPGSVTVEILKDGEVTETVVLSSDNNWSYTWTAADDGSTWNVVEKDVPDEYYVNCSVRETSFVLTNTLRQTPPGGDPTPPGTDAPQTGDSFPLVRCIAIMCISGMIIFVVGACSMRGKRDARKK